jgi:hypothetical protein
MGASPATAAYAVTARSRSPFSTLLNALKPGSAPVTWMVPAPPPTAPAGVDPPEASSSTSSC